jgi:mannose-6-phosphate isomerase
MSPSGDPHAKSDVRPWGRWEVVLEEPSYRVKRIVVLPGKRLSYQTHKRRSEHWVVVGGRGLATLDGRQVPLGPGDSVDVPLQAPHRMANPGTEDLVFIEVQRGSYFGEDDIVRLEDDFGRAGKG